MQSWTPQLVLGPLRQSPPTKWVATLWAGILTVIPLSLGVVMLAGGGLIRLIHSSVRATALQQHGGGLGMGWRRGGSAPTAREGQMVQSPAREAALQQHAASAAVPSRAPSLPPSHLQTLSALASPRGPP